MSDAPALNVLVVGTGSVGTVFATALQRGGARVTWYTRPAYAEALRSGVQLNDLNRGHSETVHPHEVCDDASALRARSFDLAVLCVSSTALRGDWFPSFAEAARGVACWCVLQPGMDDRAWVADHVGGASTMGGLITFIAWTGGLEPDEDLDDVVSVWRPPLSRIPLEGDASSVQPFATVLGRGGLPARAADGLAERGALPTAVMMPAIVGLELSGWSMSRFARSDAAATSAAAAREATDIVCALRSLRRPWYSTLLRGPLLGALARVAPLLVPFDLERYLQVHFTKVGDQTRDFLATWVEAASRLDVAAPHLSSLHRALPPA